jgi:hypothetical protein
LYGHETLSLAPKKENNLRLSGNRVLKTIFGPKREEVTGDCRKLHNEDIHNLHSSSNIIMIIKSRFAKWVEELRNLHEMLLGKPECNGHFRELGIARA